MYANFVYVYYKLIKGGGGRQYVGNNVMETNFPINPYRVETGFISDQSEPFLNNKTIFPLNFITRQL